MKLTAFEENAKTLAALLGIDEEKAIELLDLTILVTVDTENRAAFFTAERVIEMLSRTISRVISSSGRTAPSLEIVIGSQNCQSTAQKIWVSISDSAISIGKSNITSSQSSPLHRGILLLGACYICAYAMKTIFEGLPLSQSMAPIVIDQRELLGDDVSSLDNSIDIGNNYLAGAGAIGNAFLYALRFFKVKGRINIVDPKAVRDGNLNRCMFLNTADIGFQKADRLAGRAQPFFHDVELIAHNTILKNVPGRSDGAWLGRIIVGVDSRRARRLLQSEIPGEVFDASTTDIREVVFHHHRQPTQGACLSCIYHEEPLEHAHEIHVAEVLGVTVQDVQMGFINDQSAGSIGLKYPHLNPVDLIGKAYDTLFKQMCGEGQFKTSEDRQVLAPFCFVSVLAGAYQAIEFIRRVQKNTHDGLFNYWRLSPWASPQKRLRSFKPAKVGCVFCGDEVNKRIVRLLWDEPGGHKGGHLKK